MNTKTDSDGDGDDAMEAVNYEAGSFDLWLGFGWSCVGGYVH